MLSWIKSLRSQCWMGTRVMLTSRTGSSFTEITLISSMWSAHSIYIWQNSPIVTLFWVLCTMWERMAMAKTLLLWILKPKVLEQNPCTFIDCSNSALWQQVEQLLRSARSFFIAIMFLQFNCIQMIYQCSYYSFGLIAAIKPYLSSLRLQKEWGMVPQSAKPASSKIAKNKWVQGIVSKQFKAHFGIEEFLFK